MANTSRDTFRLTNALYQLATGQTVADPRLYVGTRQQQGVPVLDADWNELEDIRRFDYQLHLRFFYGNGIPSGSDGFRIGPVTVDNDFSIGLGLGLVEGWSVLNLVPDLTYLGQAAALGVTVAALNSPGIGLRDDLVYLDVWEEETPGQGTPRADSRLIHPLIGLETCTRIERRWAVTVAEGVTDPAAVALTPGHVMLPLARLHRVEGETRIRPNRIFDLRRTDLNVAKYLKVPVHVERGGDLVDSTKVADLLRSLREIFGSRLESSDLFVTAVSDHDRSVVYFAVQHIAQICSTGEIQARTKALTSDDALLVLQQLADAQGAFLGALSTHGDAGAEMPAFVNDYRAHLDGGVPGLPGVNPPLAGGDLIGAYLGQQTLNAWLSAPVGTLPEGDVSVEYLSVNPVEALQAGHAYVFTVQFTSNVTSDAGSEIFDVFASLTSDLWSVDRTTDQITLINNGGKGTLSFTVVPSAANVQCVFAITARARRNPAVQSTQPGLSLQIGQVPNVGAILIYAGPPLNADNRMELSAGQLTSGFGTSIPFNLSNRTDTPHTYMVEWFLSLAGGANEAGWSPVESAKHTNPFPVPQQTVGGAALDIAGPTGGAVIGQVGTFHVVLILIDGAPPAPGQAASLDVDFIAL